MTFVGAETFAVCTIPGADDVIFANGEDEVAFFGEPKRDGSVRSLFGCEI